MTYRLTVNGGSHEVAAAPETPLLYVLRNDLGLNGPKFGCGLGQCGACAAIVGGDLVRTCSAHNKNGAVTSAVLVHLRVEPAHFDWRWRERPALALLAWEALARDPLVRL